MTALDPSAVLMLALGMLARDRKSDLASCQRMYLQQRLRTVHALGMPLVLTALERNEFIDPLLSYVAIHRPRILDIVRSYLEESR